MTIDEILEKIKKLKIKHGKLLSNIIFPINNLDKKFIVIDDEEGIVFVSQEENRKRAYFATKNSEILIELLRKLPKGTVLEYIYKDENDLNESFLKAGMCKYSKYIRITTCYNNNPYLIKENGRRKILESMYDASFGECPSVDDAEELYRLTREIFDPICDDVFTLEEWRNIILSQEALVYKIDGEISACYVWRLEGKKLYSNLTFNKGTANILYNMERRVFEKMWENGIRIYYCWLNEKNIKALKRINENAKFCIKYINYIYNSVYVS